MDLLAKCAVKYQGKNLSLSIWNICECHRQSKATVFSAVLNVLPGNVFITSKLFSRFVYKYVSEWMGFLSQIWTLIWSRLKTNTLDMTHIRLDHIGFHILPHLEINSMLCSLWSCQSETKCLTTTPVEPSKEGIWGEAFLLPLGTVLLLISFGTHCCLVKWFQMHSVVC